ncbi:hypothetical protein D9619_009298 [Psilocybe cf. subviscida]|uniref:Uncharacterized protein n=1 Tax=Psilocybe cf. subviscida TaxID=2480587 RepID=A0A8H5BTU5_9AGAR|nr:hypothetical protein D9619_009298 [Psilocybe cf. subviscida]
MASLEAIHQAPWPPATELYRMRMTSQRDRHDVRMRRDTYHPLSAFTTQVTSFGMDPDTAVGEMGMGFLVSPDGLPSTNLLSSATHQKDSLVASP